ncbi:MAG: tyrosine-type recombinase/integrase [Desulfobulbaceae bacterium]|nr:tyrosine-type recombinase/integrase [Desulfobulbaceae bacterium]
MDSSSLQATEAFTLFSYIWIMAAVKSKAPWSSSRADSAARISQDGFLPVCFKVTMAVAIINAASDDIIFRTMHIRHRIILELMARGGMRIGEVLNLRPCDIQERNLTIQNP